MIVFFAVPLFCIVFFADAFAGAWTCARARMYNKFSFNYYHAQKRFDDNGDRQNFSSDGEFQDVNGNYYLEYGYTDELTLIGSLYYKYIEFKDNNSQKDSWGVADIDVAARYKLAEGYAGIFSVQGLVKIPGFYHKDEALPLGNKQFDFEGRLLYGRSLWPHFPGYYNLEVAYRYRAEDPADEFRYLVELGVDCTKKIYGRVKLDGILSINNAADTVDESGNPSTTNEFDLGKLDMALGYRINPSWSLELGYVPDLYGENISSGVIYSFAVIYEID